MKTIFAPVLLGVGEIAKLVNEGAGFPHPDEEACSGSLLIVSQSHKCKFNHLKEKIFINDVVSPFLGAALLPG
jgi:hypothetical protein